MVTIRLPTEVLVRNYGQGYRKLLKEYASVIGYSVEEGDEFALELNPDRLDLASFPTIITSAKHFYSMASRSNDIVYSDEKLIDLREDALKLRPYVLTFTADGRRIGDDLDLLIQYQEKLHETIGKGRKMSSIGMHDIERVSPPFEFIKKGLEFEFTTYDGTHGKVLGILRNHPKGMEFSRLLPEGKHVPVILDSNGEVLSMPPVINGIASRLTSETRKFFVDITGTDLRAATGTMYLMANFMSCLGYNVAIHPVNAEWYTQSRDFGQRKIDLEIEEVRSYLNTGSHEIADMLRKMGYQVIEDGRKKLKVGVPGHRVDVMGAVDIIEDIGKAMGYDNISVEEIPLATIGTPDPMKELMASLRGICISMGYQEVINFFITSPSVNPARRSKSNVRIINPKSEENSVLRSDLYPSILSTFRVNKQRPTPQRVFETGAVMVNGIQSFRLCLGEIGTRASFNECRKTLDSIFSRTIGSLPFLKKGTNPDFISGRSGIIELEGREIGTMGEVDPSALTEFELGLPATIIELDLDLLKSMF
ncbi:MAG: phenylalanine--tRNA ligase subunit beta [Candidatus Thermoplasmatota archaeon]|jgi:phenylalanyl-tRNA synthetase beta chain|nr:phenylalanine--tRNA ligase subunit beta [Candidatus Thermoplasmatota archaeon]MCL5800103.1 phenylalanine--tRNA ligase subunit beta [Candidatus Thermoplasmatota archaeon]